MKVHRFLTVLGGITVLMLSMVLPAEASSNRGFRGYASCSMSSYDADRNCWVGSAYVAAFIAKKRDRVRYTLCVTNRRTGARDCFSKRTRGAGSISQIPIWNRDISEDPGLYRLKWRVAGKGIVARATIRVHIGD